jgi:hypothetical protein
MELYSQNISFEAILWNCILKIFSLRQLCEVVFPHFPLRQLCIIVFSKHFIWGNSLELYSHTFLFGNSAELYSQNTFFEAILLNCILKTFPFEAILRNCILTLFLLGQLCKVAFPQMSEDIISPHE